MYRRVNPDISFQEWFKEALPAIIFQHIIQAKAVKVCSSIAPVFGIVARHYGYDAYVISAPGHFLNVIVTPEGPIEIDLSAIQFRVCDFVEEEDVTRRDLYGVKKALKKVLRHIIRDPRRAVKIQSYEGSMEALQEPRVNELYYQHYLDSFERALEDIEALRRKDSEVYELYDDIQYLDEWEADIEYRTNPQRICASCQELKPHDERRRNPEFSKLYYEGYEESTTLGYTQREIYKIILFADYLPQEEEQIIRGNKWLARNTHKLPVEIQDMQIEDIFLTVRTSEYRKNYVWNLTYHENGPRLGDGIFCDSVHSKRGDDEPGYYEDCTAGISLRGFRIYPAILKFMRSLLGPLRSDTSLTPGATSAWIRAGGESRNRRWYLD